MASKDEKDSLAKLCYLIYLLAKWNMAGPAYSDPLWDAVVKLGLGFEGAIIDWRKENEGPDQEKERA